MPSTTVVESVAIWLSLTRQRKWMRFHRISLEKDTTRNGSGYREMILLRQLITCPSPMECHFHSSPGPVDNQTFLALSSACTFGYKKDPSRWTIGCAKSRRTLYVRNTILIAVRFPAKSWNQLKYWCGRRISNIVYNFSFFQNEEICRGILF